ncbi:hypothetical protein D9M71_506840 [compost metagenome]
MEGIDQHATVFPCGVLDDTHGLEQVLGVGPGHELQVRVQAIVAGQVAQGGEVIGLARLVRVIAGHQQLARCELGANGQQGLEIADLGLGLQAQDFHVQHFDTGVAQTLGRLPAQVGIADQGEVFFLRGCRLKAQAYVTVASTGGHLDHVYRGQLQDGQGRQGQDTLAHECSSNRSQMIWGAQARPLRAASRMASIKARVRAASAALTSGSTCPRATAMKCSNCRRKASSTGYDSCTCCNGSCQPAPASA